jgi:hypothetical protein
MDPLMEAREALETLRALIAHWREDKAFNLTPTDGSLERALRRIDVIEAALCEKEAA